MLGPEGDPTGARTPVVADVAIIGDGPAGSALAAAITRFATGPGHSPIDVALIGPDEPWTNTYSAWADEIESNPITAEHAVWQQRVDTIDVRSRTVRTLDRAYGVIDNDAFRTLLRNGVRHERRRIDSLRDVDARIVFDATGWPSKIVAPTGPLDVGWQIAYGVVLSSPPAGPLGRPMLMDFSDPYAGTRPGDDLGVTTFAYSLPVADGWLVEETVLVGPDVAPVELRPRLAARLGTTVDELVASALSVEEVRIPMGAPMSTPSTPVAFGATAGLIHPATGYSIAGSLRAAHRVARAVDVEFSEGGDIAAPVIHDAVWPRPSRRTRRLHEYGLDVLTRLDDEQTRDFFETFFELDEADQRAYLNIETAPSALAAVMTRMFARSSWSMRRRLAGGDPFGLARVLRP